MDPALHELARRGEPSDEVAVIIRLRDPAVLPRACRVVAHFGDVVTGRVRRDAIGELWTDPVTLSVKAPHDYGPELEPPPTTAELADLPDVDAEPRRPAGLGPTGLGVVIGMVDWGCDFAHPDLRRPDGRTRLLALWDQRPVPAAHPFAAARRSAVAEPYGFGRIFDAGAINEALGQVDPYQALGYDPGDFDAGPGAHGTHTLSIAAGNGRAGGPVGLAPEADCVFVSLGRQSDGGTGPLGHSVELLEAIDFIVQAAGERPWVINLSLGRHAGEHTGRTLVERAMDHLVAAAPGRAIVQSCGNYFRRRTHWSWQLRPGEVRAIRVEVDPSDRTTNEVDLWYPGGDRIDVRLSTPDGRERVEVPLGSRGSIAVGGRSVARAYHRACDPNNHDNQLSVFLEPDPAVPEWDVTLTALDIVDGRVHAWIERDNACRKCQSQFPAGSADPRSTLGTIANGFRTIVVGAYDRHRSDRPPALFSSSGPTRDGRAKPDLVAPGSLELGARSRPRHSSAPPYVRMSGTSMAAPAVTGTVALMFQAAGRKLTIAETRRALLRGCDPPPEGADRRRLGGGYLNPERALEAVMCDCKPDAEAAFEEYEEYDEYEAESEPDAEDVADPEAEVEAGSLEASAMEGLLATEDAGGLKCPRFAGDPELAAVLAGKLRLGAKGTRPVPAPVRSGGPAVRKVQQALMAAGYPLPVFGADGDFGRETGTAVSRFKTDHGLEPTDPVVGPGTIQALDDVCTGKIKGCSLEDVRVAIVGGGFAGLMAAWSLHSGRVKVTVFEGRQRLGGRVWSDRSIIKGKVVEAGAELIGDNHPTWNMLRKTFKLEFLPVAERKRLRFGTKEFTPAEIKKLEADVQPIKDTIGREAKAIDALRPWLSPDAAKLDKMSVAERLDQPDMFGPTSSDARHLFEFITENDQCAPLNQQSYLGLLAAVKAHSHKGDMTAYWTLTETRRCKGGNDQLVPLLSKGLKDVRLSTPVTDITIRGDGVRISFGGAKPGAQDFDYVILTAPPTVWPTVTSTPAFKPRDYSMADGPAVKFLSSFDTRFWEKRKLLPSTLWDQIGSVWESTDGQDKPNKGFGLSVYSGGRYVLNQATYEARMELIYPDYGREAKHKSLVDWPHMPGIMAGYAIPAPGQVTTVGRNLSKPFQGRLFFAGEQASPGFFGYMEGALQSGVFASYQVAAAARTACRAKAAVPPTPTRSTPGPGRRPSFGVFTASRETESVEPATEWAPEWSPDRPKRLRFGTTHSAVCDAQQRLNLYHAAEVAAGRPGLGAALVEDCAFGAKTRAAVLAFQKQVFPGLTSEQDGTIGDRTWAQLDLVPSAPAPPAAPATPAVRAGFTPPGPPSPPLPSSRLFKRPCCMLASALMRGASSLGLHADRVPGIVYTGLAGFVDAGHLWEVADQVAFIYQSIQAAAGASGTKITTNEGEATLTSTVPKHEWLEVAKSIAYDDALSHEIGTYTDGVGTCGNRPLSAGGHNSSFSPEDLPSNYLGTVVAERALSAGGTYVTEAEKALKSMLAVLKAQSPAETDRAFDLIKNRWVDASVSIANNCFLQRRNFTSVPWKAGHSSDGPTPRFVTKPFLFRATYDYQHKNGFTRATFPAEIATIKADARTRYGASFASPV